jgi:phage baseplate assembly protein V
MLRFGRISDIDASKGMARVSFAEDGTVSDWMSMVVSKTGDDKFFYLPDVNEQVACLMGAGSLRGVILGAIYSDNRTPDSANSGAGILSIVFSNGDKVRYNGNNGQMDITASGGVTINGNLTVNGTVDASLDVTAGPLNVSLTGHTHTVAGVQLGTGSVTTTPPL